MFKNFIFSLILSLCVFLPQEAFSAPLGDAELGLGQTPLHLLIPEADLEAAVQEMDDFYARGDFESAEIRLRVLIDSFAAHFGPTHPDTLVRRTELANTLGQMTGRGMDSLQMHYATHELWKANYPKFHPQLNMAAMGHAMQAMRMGYVSEALPMASEATRYAELAFGKDHPTTILWQYNTAGIYDKLGYLEEALNAYHVSLDRMDRAGGPRMTRYALYVSRSIARTQRDLGRTEEAADSYADALTRFKAVLNPEHPEIVYTLSEYAQVLSRLKRWDQAAVMVDEAEALARQTFGTDGVYYADILHRRAILRTYEGPDSPGWAAGIADMRQALAIMDATLGERSEAAAKIRLDLSLMLQDAGDIARAWDVALVGEQTGTAHRSSFLGILADARDAGVVSHAEAAQHAFRAAQLAHWTDAKAAVTVLTRRVALGDSLAAQYFRELSDLERREEALQDELSWFASLPAGQRDLTREKQLRADLQATHDALMRVDKDLSREAPQFMDMMADGTLELTEAQALLAEDEALVILDIGKEDEDLDFALVVTHDDAVWRDMGVRPSQLALAVSDLRDSISLKLGVRAAAALDDEGDGTVLDFDLYASQYLYDQTFRLIEDVIADKKHLYLDLRGPMTAVPPQLLIRNAAETLEDANWMVRHHAMTVVPSAYSLKVAQLMRDGGRVRASQPILAFADPVFEGTGDMQMASLSIDQAGLRGALAPLPETRDEAEQVARTLGAGPQTVWAQGAASEAALKQTDLEAYQVLYFATHGLVAGDMVQQGETVAEPALALTAGDGEDGLLSASEITQLSLNADWVVLSACNTAVGDEPGAEALSGLAQAFTYAGARALLVSHWPVESQSAVQLMTDLFTRRASGTAIRAAEAQQQAMLAMIDGPRDEWRHPAFWAPFILVGTPD